MKGILLAVLVLGTANAFAAARIDCKVASNQSDVVSVEFLDSEQISNYFKTMNVLKTDGSVETFIAETALDPLQSESVERFNASTFVGANGQGFASIRHQFFSRPEDRNQSGFSPKNGVKINVILPPATERLRMNCVRTN